MWNSTRRGPAALGTCLLGTCLLAPCLLAALAVTGCRQEPPAPEETPAAAAETSPAAAFAAEIEQAHGLAAWRSRPAFSADIDVYFGGDLILDGRMLFPTDLSASRLDLADGTTAVFDGERAWVHPASSQLQAARFHLLTWPYFLAVPMKLRDPGTRLEPVGERQLQGESYDAARLTFEPGVGDTPDDWYLLYRDRASGQLAAMAYVVTYGTSLAEAEKEPHAITYEQFVDVDGVAVPTLWRFWLWNEEQGIHGEPIGRVELADPALITAELSAFDRLEGAREDALPPAAGG